MTRKTKKTVARKPKTPAKAKELLALRKAVAQDRKTLIRDLATVAAAINEVGNLEQIFGPVDDLIDPAVFADFCNDLLLAPKSDCCKTPAGAQAPKAKLMAQFDAAGRNVDIRLTATHPCGIFGFNIDARISRFRPATPRRPARFDRVTSLKTLNLSGLSGDLDESLSISVDGLVPGRPRPVFLVEFAATVASPCAKSPFARVSRSVIAPV